MNIPTRYTAELLVVSFLFAALVIYAGALVNVVAGWVL